MKINPIAHPAVLAALCLSSVLFSGVAQAQLMVDMQLNKKNFVDHEPITATVRVKNIAGHDLILSGPDGGGWLNFDVRRGNNGLSLRPDAPTIKPHALKAGATHTTTVNLGRYYPLGLPSNYAITASVYYLAAEALFQLPAAPHQRPQGQVALEPSIRGSSGEQPTSAISQVLAALVPRPQPLRTLHPRRL